MSIFGLKLDASTHDLLLKDGQLLLVQDDGVIARNLKTRLLMFKGEWILDNTYGYEYRNILGQRIADLQLIESSLKSYILDTEGIVSISRFIFDYLPENNRQLVLTLGVVTVNNTTLEIGGTTFG